MQLNKGLNTDVAQIDQPEGSWRDSRNIIFSRNYDSISNEDGFDFLFELAAQPICAFALDRDEWVVMLAGEGYDEIGLVSEGTYQRILKTTDADDRLNLNADYPPKGKFRVSNRGHRIIAFTDNLNPPRILNIDSLPFPTDAELVPTQAGSINTLNIFSAGDPPNITYSLINSGGFVKSGAYFFSCSYTASDNTETSYFTATGPVKINDDTTGTFTYDGCPAGTITSRSIALSLTNVDNRYRFLNIGVISVIAGETKFQKVGSIEIIEGVTSYNFTYVGNETTEDLLLEQLTVQFQGIYQTAKAITVLNDQLVLGNLSTRPPVDFQAIANDITITWKIDRVYNNSNTAITRSANLQEGGFRAFEVYAFYIVLRYKDGSYSPAYHIPGRVAVAGETDNSTLASAQGITAKKFHVEDTCSTDGTMSYWENEAEVYPSDFPDFAGQKVRHHKFPSLNFLMTNAAGLGFSTLSTKMGKTEMPILSYEANFVNIPTELLPVIDGWQIYYAKRDINNQTCVGQGHLIFSHESVGNVSNFSSNNNIYVGLTNARTNIKNQDLPNTTSFRPASKPCTTKLSFHSPDLMINKPAISPTYVRNEIKLEINSDDNSNKAIFCRIEGGEPSNQRATIDYAKETTKVSASPTVSGSLIRRITPNNPFYVAPNVIDGRYFNFESSEYISMDINNAATLDISNIWSDSVSVHGVIPTGRGGLDEDLAREKTYLTNLCQLIKTVYSSFTSQNLVASTNIIDPQLNGSSGSLTTGDNYVQIYNFVGTMFRESDISDNLTEPDTSTEIHEGLKIIRQYMCECNINIKLRHEGVDSNSKFYGKSGSIVSDSDHLKVHSYPLLDNWDVTKSIVFEYNSDYNALNTFNPVFPRNTTIDNLERFPYRIIISEKNANELADSGWRTFLPNNYYDMVTTKGEISNLEAWDDVLLIHLENSLYRTVGVQRLKTTTEDVTIGTGELFKIPPKEVITSELGYLGNQNLFGCGITKLGYVFFDASQGKLFLVNQEVKELSSQGLRNFFRDNMKGEGVDKPFTSYGFNLAYDEKYNRMLVSKKGVKTYTLSYSPDVGGFVSFHDYIPDYMLNTRNKVFSIKGLKVYEHNSTNKATYYDEVVYPSYIEVIFNDASNITKQARSISWQTDLINDDGTYLFDKTFTKALVTNGYQCSGDIVLVKGTNVFNAETTWNFNNFYDVVLNRSLPYKDSNGLILSNLSTSLAWFKQRRFVDKWHSLKLTYDNIDQNTLFLYDVNMLMKKSSR